MKKKLLRGVGALLMADGLATLLTGRKYVGLYRFGSRSSLYRKAVEGMLDWPEWKLRSAGALEAALGVAALSQAPFDVQSLYGSLAGGYAAIDPGWREWFYPQAHDAFDQALVNSLPDGGTILDLGCGVGANMARIQAMKLPYGAYTGVDLTPAMLRRAKARYGQLPNVNFVQLDLMTDPLPAGPYDLIISTWVFEHLSDPVLVAEKAWEQLKPGGHMVLLFEVEVNTWLSRLVDWVYPFFSARLVRNAAVRRLPGIQSERRFDGPLGELAFVVAQKPA